MAFLGRARRALALLDDGFQRLARRFQVGDGDQPVHAHRVWPDLERRIADEHRGLAVARHQRPQPGLDRPIEVADGQIVLRRRGQLQSMLAAFIDLFANEGVGVRLVRAFRPLEIDEVLQRIAVEWRQAHDQAGGQHAGRDREIATAEMGDTTDRVHQIGHQGQMGHLVDGDIDDGTRPLGDLGARLGVDIVVGLGLQAPSGIEIAAHQVVLDLGRFGERVEQLLAIMDADRRFGKAGVGHAYVLHPGLVPRSATNQDEPCKSWIILSLMRLYGRLSRGPLARGSGHSPGLDPTLFPKPN